MKLFHDPQRLAFAAVALAFLIIRVCLPASLAETCRPDWLSVSVADQVLLVAIIPFSALQ